MKTNFIYKIEKLKRNKPFKSHSKSCRQYKRLRCEKRRKSVVSPLPTPTNPHHNITSPPESGLITVDSATRRITNIHQEII